MLDIVFTGVDAVQEYDNVLTVTLSDPVVAGVNAAPAAVWFEVDAVSGASAELPAAGDTYDPQYHEILYAWEFGDTANALPTTPLNIPARWKDINQGRGRIAAHVYDAPGSYTVTCLAYEPSTRRFGVATQTVTIANPDTVFPGGQTIIYNPDSLAGLTMPAGAQEVSTWAGAMTARAGSAGPTRILFAPGAVLTIAAGDKAVSTFGGTNLRVGALDASATRASIRCVGRQGAGDKGSFLRDRTDNGIEAAFYDIDFVGEWDSTTETGRIVRPFDMDKSSLTAPAHLFMLHRCGASGWETLRGPFSINANAISYTMYSDCDITDWQNYGIVSGSNDAPTTNTRTAVIGSSVAQHVDALSGGQKNQLFNNHGPIRDFGSGHLYVSACYFFSRNGWSTGGSDANGVRITADQPALRINTTAERDKFSYVDRTVCEGGMVFHHHSGSTNAPCNHVGDRILQVAGPMNYVGNLNEIQQGGTTLRNIVSLKLDLPDVSVTTGFDRFFRHHNLNGVSDNGAAGVRIHNVTAIDMRTDTNAQGKTIELLGAGSAPFPVLFEENNLLQNPNRTASTPVPGETIDLAEVADGFAPRHKGPRWSFSYFTGSVASAVANGSDLTVPYSDILDGPYDSDTGRSGNPTNQAYWQATEATDVLHRIRVAGVVYHADAGEISVTFGASGVSITNNTGATWAAGASMQLKLDRSSRLPGFDAQYDATLLTLGSINATDPLTTSAADMGLAAHDTYGGQLRPVSGDRRGAL